MTVVMLPPILVGVASAVPHLGDASSMLVLLGGGGILGAAMSMLLAQLGRDLGKKKEAQLFADWGGMPTTLLLRRRPTALPEGLRLNAEARERIRQLLPELLPDLPLPTMEQETSNPEAADERFEAIAAELRGRTYDTKRFPLLFAENCGYGFRRNLWAMRPVGLLLAMGSTLAASVLLALAPERAQPLPLASSLVVVLLVAVWWSIRINRDWVKMAAFEYAQQLLMTVQVLVSERNGR